MGLGIFFDFGGLIVYIHPRLWETKMERLRIFTNRYWVPVIVIGSLGALLNPNRIQAQQPFQDSIPDSVRLRVVFPADGDTLNFDRIRYAGSVLPGAAAFVQGQKVKVYPTGAFVGMVNLQPGESQIVFSSHDSLGEVSDTLRIFREPPLVSYQASPTAINTNRVFPARDVYLMRGDALEVEFMGSPGGHSIFSIDKLAKNLNMIEMPSKSQGALKGVYKGTIMIPRVNKYKPKPVEFKFRGKDGRTLKFKSEGRIHLLSEATPVIGVTADSSNLVLTEPDGEIWMVLPADVKMQIIGKRRGFAKVRFADNVVGYISSSSLQTLPSGSSLPSASVGSIGTLRDGDWVQVRVNLSERVPFRIDQMIEPAALEVTFYRARQAPHWISYPKDDETLRLIKWQQESGEIFVLRLELNQSQQWGFWGRYVDNQFWLNIRRTPRLTSARDSLLRGLTIAVDPGHGGEFEGTVSPTGLLEKNVNLQYAMIVADLLEAEGAEVVRTRAADTTMTLQARMAMAREAQANIFLSLHNNSIGAATNPLRPRGTSTYYTVPQSQAIAKRVYDRLLELELRPYGRVASTYFVTRQTDLISLIVEGAFLSHPVDEMLLMDEHFLADLAKAVVDGVKDFVADIGSSEFGFHATDANKPLPSHPGGKGSN